MKALIVDDEQHVRNSVRLLADWQALGIDTVLEAENGSSALMLIQEQEPEIIITDIMMPLLNGFELMERIQALNSRKHKFIVVSGYNDFTFIQHTMRSGGIDYLLKPVDQQQLQKALGKAVEYCRTEIKWEESKKLEQEMHELQLLYRDKTLSELLIKRGVHAIPEALIRALPGLVHAASARAAVVRFNAWEPGMVAPADTDSNVQLAAWLERLNAALTDKQFGVAFKNWNQLSEIVILTWNNLSRTDILYETVRRYSGAAAEAGMHIGIGSEVDFPAFMYKSYDEAIHALSHRNMLSAELRIHLYSEPAADDFCRLRFDLFEEKILIAVKSGNKEQIRKAVREWSEYLRGLKRMGLLYLHHWLDEYKIIKERWLDSFYKDASGAGHRSAPAAFQIPLNASANMDLTALENAMIEDLIRLQHIFIQSRQSRQLNIMQEIALFLQTNYWRDIHRQEISDRFYLNKEHISRRFKQEFGETITDYTNQIRIEKAKVLLLNLDLRISEIAIMIGYRDEKYFSRVFKKIEKMPPNLYRSRISELSYTKYDY